jgi:hypothetical protein
MLSFFFEGINQDFNTNSSSNNNILGSGGANPSGANPIKEILLIFKDFFIMLFTFIFIYFLSSGYGIYVYLFISMILRERYGILLPEVENLLDFLEASRAANNPSVGLSHVISLGRREGSSPVTDIMIKQSVEVKNITEENVSKSELKKDAEFYDSIPQKRFYLFLYFMKLIHDL